MNDENYDTWKSELFDILVNEHVHFVLYTDCPEGPNPVLRGVWDPYERWIQSDEIAQMYILERLSFHMYRMVELAATAREMINIIQDTRENP